MTTASARRLAALEGLFKALADGTRLRILSLLTAGETCVCDIYESLRIPQPRASRHLAYLRRAGLVDTRKQGLWVYYRLADPADPVLRTMLSATTHCLTHVDATGRDQQRLAKRRVESRLGEPELPTSAAAATETNGHASGAACCAAAATIVRLAQGNRP